MPWWKSECGKQKLTSAQVHPVGQALYLTLEIFSQLPWVIVGSIIHRRKLSFEKIKNLAQDNSK